MPGHPPSSSALRHTLGRLQLAELADELLALSVAGALQQRPAGQERWPQPGRRSRQQRWLLQRDQAGARALRPRNQLAASAAHRASAIRSLPWQAVRRSRKSPLHARALAQIMSAPPFPGTSASAASKSATGNSTPRSRRLTSHSQGARNEGRRNRSSALGKAFRSGGTESSNPASSSGESGTNRCAGKRTRAETWDLAGLAWRSADGCGPARGTARPTLPKNDMLTGEPSGRRRRKQ
jgi:hypothetical protein